MQTLTRQTTKSTAQPPRTPPRSTPARAYARLAKLDIYDYYFSLPIVWAMLPPADRLNPRDLAVLLLVLAGQITLCAAVCAFDDVTGYRDGSDLANYGPDKPARRLARKPLIAGTLTERQAVRLGWSATAAYTVCWTAAAALAPHRPAWALAGIVLCVAFGFQYSWWLTLSYHGMQELFVVSYGWAFLLLPHALLVGAAGGFALVQILLFGLGPLLFGVYSNTHDIDGDRAVNRPTAATALSPRGNAALIGALSLAEASLILGSAALGLAPRWFAALLAPVIALRALQFALGMVRGRILQARLLGIRIHRAASVLLVVANLVHGGTR